MTKQLRRSLGWDPCELLPWLALDHSFHAQQEGSHQHGQVQPVGGACQMDIRLATYLLMVCLCSASAGSAPLTRCRGSWENGWENDVLPHNRVDRIVEIPSFRPIRQTCLT